MTVRYEALDWYDTPRYYDILFREDTAIEASFLEAMHALHVRSRGRRVLEPACGSGRLLVEMARRAYQVAGFDRSESMLAFARESLDRAGLGTGAVLRVAALEDFRLPGRFDLAFCLVSTFKYLLDESAARAHLEAVARALKSGGVYVLGLHLTQYDWERNQRERWSGQHRGTRVVCNLTSWPPDRRRRRERIRSRLRVEHGGRARGIETSWEFRTYDARQLRALLDSVPELEHVTTYDFTYDLESERALDDEQMDCVLVLRKR